MSAPLPAAVSGADDDGTLAALALSGREDAYRALMARHRDAVYQLVRAQIEDSDGALDVTQESFIAAFAHLDRYDPARPFRFWIMRIAINKARDWRRRRKVRSFFSRARPMDEGLQVSDIAPGQEQQAAARQELARTRRAIDALPENLRSVLLLRTIEGMSQTEVAALLGLSEKAVETRLYRARMKLTESLRV
ncbi:sigma-70 family RNA polymerase sigma factor [Novosphingobium sp. P6W]|uniref:RNA polymerase sigma factor n=1 Tax=Novosphingobium sp. P6W TaxID=1609758 RepID=UPI000A69CD3B|nr:sigma-70 family RNA polymerase sigma factor [Novosphingobium sp. P6W]